MPLKLFKRRTKDGFVWHYRGTIAGNLIRGSTGTTDRKAAKTIAFDKETDVRERGPAAPKKGLSLTRAVESYLRAHSLHPRERKYIARVLAHWGKRALVKSMTPGAIRQSAIEIHPNDTAATRNRQVITPTQAIINHCAELEMCAPVRIKRFKEEKKIKQPVTLEWLDTFCAHASPLTAALATFMFATGCRISEARRLEWADIDFQQRTMLIVKTKAKHQRLPHMPQRLLVALANLPRDQSPFGRPETALRRLWDQDVATTAAAVPGFVRLTFHSCRHGMATKLLRDGVDVVTAAGLAGMSVGVMLSTYAHALQKPQMTEQLFSTPQARDDTTPEQKQEVTRK